VPISSFVGRDGDLARAVAMLAKPRRDAERPGWVGKTAAGETRRGRRRGATRLAAPRLARGR
jgi:hypothetical protein